MKTEFTTGDLAFFDSFAGCIPCKVLSIEDKAKGTRHEGSSSDCRISVKLTANRGAYKRGEVLENDALKIIPRPFVRGNRILGGYRWI